MAGNTERRNDNMTPSLTAKSNANNNNDVILWGDPATHALLISGSISAGTLTNNNAAPSTANQGVLPAVANAGAPTWTEGNQVLLSTDLSGALRVTGSLSVGGTTDGATFTASTSTGTTALGFYHTTIDTVADGKAAAIAIDSKRSQFMVIRDAALNARGANVDANNNLGVVLPAETTKVIGTIRNVGNVGAIFDAATGAAIPANAVAMGMSDGTNMQMPKGFDLDSGAGTDYNIGVSLRLAASGGSGEVKNGQGDGASAALMLNVLPMMYNGSTHDRFRGAVNALNSTGTGLLAVQLNAQFDDVSPTAITENQFGNMRMSTNRNLYVTMRDAAGNERGLNIDASGQLAVTIAAAQTIGITANSSVNLAQVGGTNIVTGGVAGSQSIGGTVATNVAITANPINNGAQAVSAENTAVTATRQVQLVADLVGKLIVLPYANPENFVSGVTAAMTGTTTTSLIAAPAAGLRNYITHIIGTNSHATVGTFILIQDGSGGTTLYEGYAAAVGGGFSITLPTPLRQPTTATAIFCANVTTGANTIVSASGYKGA